MTATLKEDGIQLGFEALERTAGKHDARIRALVPVAIDLAASGRAITVADVREEAVRRGLLTGKETGRDLSFLGAVMKRAKLRPFETFRRSTIEQSHGNLNREWGL